MSRNNASESSIKLDQIIYINDKQKREASHPKNSQRRVVAVHPERTSDLNAKSAVISGAKIQGSSKQIKVQEVDCTSSLDASTVTGGFEYSQSMSTERPNNRSGKSANAYTIRKVRGKATTVTIRKCNAIVNPKISDSSVSVPVASELINIPKSLQITPVRSKDKPTPETPSSSSGNLCKLVQNSFVKCVKCSKRGLPDAKCVCKTALTTNNFSKNRIGPKDLQSAFITKTTIPKERICVKSSQPNSSLQQISNSYSNCVVTRKMVMSEQRGNTRGRQRGSRSKITEPVCLTISDDEEDDEPMDETPATDASLLQNSQTLILEPSSTSQIPLDYANMSEIMNNEDVEDEEMHEEEEELEEESEKDTTSSVSSSPIKDLSDENQGTRISCRSIRIGSFKIHPVDETPFVLVFANPNGFAFHVPTVDHVGDNVLIRVESSDIQDIMGHFGRCLPVMYVQTSISCGERIRKQLNMEPGSSPYFDPGQTDERQKFITFLIDHIEEKVVQYLRTVFPGDRILKEIDQKTANEILVKSTPTKAANLQIAGQTTTFQAVALASSTIRIGTIAYQIPPVRRERETHTPVKLLTYPPPPQTGGIAITNEDLSCLDEGEFLNDVIIDFYLKYLMHEKFSESDRQRTHIFSSFFYPRLTQKPNNNRNVKSAEGSKTIKMKRHSHVKTWTKNIDIFEKDFIIIPINQSNHWFLAIVCFPALAADMPKPIVIAKPLETVSSSNESEAGKTSALVPAVVKTKDQACSTDDETIPDNPNNNFSNEEEDSDGSEEASPETPDSSTHPEKNVYYKHLPCILIFDSLSGPNRNRIMSTLREYLEMEWNLKKGTPCEFNKLTMRGDILKVPQQTNFSDCGIYLLQYVESFFETPIPCFGTPMPALQDWFPAEKVANKRKDIISLITELQKRYSNSVTTNTTKKSPKKLSDKPSDSQTEQSTSVLPSCDQQIVETNNKMSQKITN